MGCMHSPCGCSAMCGALQLMRTAQSLPGVLQRKGSCLGNSIHSNYIYYLHMGCTNFTMLQVESKFEGKGILSTMVDVFNLCSFHAAVSSSQGSSGKLEFLSGLMSGF